MKIDVEKLNNLESDFDFFLIHGINMTPEELEISSIDFEQYGI